MCAKKKDFDTCSSEDSSVELCSESESDVFSSEDSDDDYVDGPEVFAAVERFLHVLTVQFGAVYVFCAI